MTRHRSEKLVHEKAFLVSVLLPEHIARRLQEDPLEEMRGLAETAGAKLVGSLVQRRDEPDKTTYLGRGKLDELKMLAEATEADVVIFDNDLSPAQNRNLEKELDLKVLDRTEVILDIFATRAQTREARLAVELAQLEYSLPRLKRMWTHLSRLKMGIGMRGPGEKQLEVDRRLVEKRIRDLREQIDEIHARKDRMVSGRADRYSVSLVGYTNAGKSTLMNRLTDADVLAQDKLFATLDTRTRRWQLPGWGPVLLSDTVGFIRDLPHSLIASFKATLEEARQADLLLHVADASNPDAKEQIASVYKVLEDLHIEAKDTILVLNKVDRMEDRSLLEGLLHRYPNAVPVSAYSGEGIEELSRVVADALSKDFADVDIEADISNGRVLAFLSAHGEVLSKQFTTEQLKVHCRIPQRFLGQLSEKEVRIHYHNGPATNGHHLNGSNGTNSHPSNGHSADLC